MAIRALPLSLARIASPDLALSGTLDGEAQLHGSASRPEGRYALKVARLVAPQTRSAGLPPIEAEAKGTLSDGQASLDGRVSAGRGVALTLSGSLPVEPGGPLGLRAKGTLDAALANSLLSVGGQSVTGRVAVDGGVTGTLASPRAEGSATLSGGSFTDPLNGIRLTGIEGRVTGRGDSLVVDRLTAGTRNGGRLAVAGRVTLDPPGASPELPGDGRAGRTRLQFADDGGGRARPVTLRAACADAEDHRPGRRRVDRRGRARPSPRDRPAAAGVRHVNTPPELRARLAKRGAPKAAASSRGRKPAAPFDATLDVTVDAPSHIFVRGRGIDAELGGSLRVTGSSRDPRAVGEFAMRRGRFDLVGQRLDFDRGRLTFAGSLTTPDLDFSAQTKAGDVTARVAVSGPADAPQFALTSDPVLPQDEILSRLLFKKAAGGLSPFQALQLAQAVAQLSGGPGDRTCSSRPARGSASTAWTSRPGRAAARRSAPPATSPTGSASA